MTWDASTNAQRGHMVRQHAAMGKVCPCCKRPISGKAITSKGLMDLFNLSPDELVTVLAGADYPERENNGAEA